MHYIERLTRNTEMDMVESNVHMFDGDESLNNVCS